MNHSVAASVAFLTIRKANECPVQHGSQDPAFRGEERRLWRSRRMSDAGREDVGESTARKRTIRRVVKTGQDRPALPEWTQITTQQQLMTYLAGANAELAGNS
jgi:hypothetical protein